MKGRNPFEGRSALSGLILLLLRASSRLDGGRTGKAHAFEDYHRQQLLEGPDACLLAGVGYLAPIRGGSFDSASPEEQAAVLAEMREDWTRCGAEMMVRWRAGERGPAVRPWVFPYLGDPDRLPWAAEEFGEPASNAEPEEE